MTNERKQRILCLITDANGEYYYNGPLDGIWGPESKKAAERFLKDFGGADGAGAADNPVGDNSAKDNNVPGKTGSFWDEIEFFDREEFRCKCGGRYCNGFPAEPREDMVRLADAARKHFGKAGHVVSGLRCKEWNRIQGGVENSQHMYGEACDLRISGVTSEQLLAFFQSQKGVRYAYKINGTNVHFDVPKGSR